MYGRYQILIKTIHHTQVRVDQELVVPARGHLKQFYFACLSELLQGA